MADIHQTNRIRKLLGLANCPTGLQDDYLNFLQTEEQQVHIIRNQVTMMFQKEMTHCQKRRLQMEGSVTFCRNKDDPSASPERGLFIGIEFMLCCFNSGIPARIADYKLSNDEVIEVIINFGMANLKLSLGKI